jgi:uncharacterized membrane protein
MALENELVDFLSWLPPWFVIIFISMIPFVELRGSIPVGIFIYDLDWWYIFPLAVIGNIIPVPIILKHLGKVERRLRKYGLWDRFFTWLYTRTRKRADEKIKKYEAIGIMFFVAIPLPFTGAWTGSLIAYLFDIKFKRAFLVVTLGVIIAGIIVTLICLFASSLLGY